MSIYQKKWENRLAIWLIFFLLLAGSVCLAQEGRPPISLYYYEFEERILMCVSGESDKKQGILFTLENGGLHGMEPRRPTYQEETILELANPDLIAFQRILLGLGYLDPILEDYVKALQETINVLKQDGDWGDKTWTKLFQYIRDETDQQETADLQLGMNQARVYRLDTIVQNREDSKEKKYLQKLLQDSNEKNVKAKSFPMNLVKAYTDLINAPTPAVTSAQDTSSRQPDATPQEEIQPERNGVSLGWVVLVIIVSVIFGITVAFLERHFDLIANLCGRRNGKKEQIKDMVWEIRREVDKIQNKKSPPFLEHIDEGEDILYQLKRIKDDVKNISDAGITKAAQSANVLEEMQQQMINAERKLFKRLDEMTDALKEHDKNIKEQLLEARKALVNWLRGVLSYIFRGTILSREKENVSAETISEYHEILQSYLESLYIQKLMQLAIPADKTTPNFNHLWFFTEYWNLNSSNKLSESLGQLQEELIKIEPELEYLRKQTCPQVIEFSEKNTLQDYLKSYQETRNQIEQFESPSIPIAEDKLPRLRNTVTRFIDRLDANQIDVKDKIETMLWLVSLQQFPIFEKYDIFYDKFHRFLGSEGSELESGTILQVRRRGFMDRTTGEIVRKAHVITAE